MSTNRLQPRPIKGGSSGLGDYLGRKDAAHVKAFITAGMAARQAPHLQCHAVTRAAPHCRCRNAAVTGSKLCIFHISLDEMVRLDADRRVRFERVARTSTWAAEREAARRSLQAIERRALKYAWTKIDPDTPGALIAFSSPDVEAKCVQWLRDRHGLDIWGCWPGTEHRVTYCGRDRLLWAALRYLIKGTLTEEKAARHVEWARKADMRYREKLRRAEAGEVVDRRRKKNPGD